MTPTPATDLQLFAALLLCALVLAAFIRGALRAMGGPALAPAAQEAPACLTCARAQLRGWAPCPSCGIAPESKRGGIHEPREVRRRQR